MTKPLILCRSIFTKRLVSKKNHAPIFAKLAPPTFLQIGVPAVDELRCVEWNQHTGILATGGTGGILKLVRIAKESTRLLFW